tara:strand:+ start:33 stop:446 length:414 start_codon:yes stop_codon:yes gene_type:complete
MPLPLEYRIVFVKKPFYGLTLQGTPNGDIFVAGFQNNTKQSHLSNVQIGDKIIGCGSIMFSNSTHATKMSCIQEQKLPVTIHFSKISVRDTIQLSKTATVQVKAINRIQRPVSRQRIGTSPIYNRGLIKEDVGDINT